MNNKEYFGFYYPNEIHASDNKEHSRLVAHKIYIGKVISPFWEKRKRDSVLRGHLEKICMFDMGQIVSSLEKGEPIFEEKILEKNKTHYFSDGSYIVGDHKIKKMIDPHKEEFFNKYLDLSFDLDNFGGFDYTFSIKKNLLKNENLFMFLIEQYVIMDNSLMPDKKFVLIKPVSRKEGLSFLKIERKNLPLEFVDIIK